MSLIFPAIDASMVLFFFFFPNKIVFFWKSLSCVWLFATPRTIALQAPLSMEFSRQILEWVAIPFSRESSQSRDKTQLPTLQVDSLPSEPPGKPKDTGMGSLSLLQWIFPAQDSNWGLLYCRWILYQLSYHWKLWAALIVGVGHHGCWQGGIHAAERSTSGPAELPHIPSDFLMFLWTLNHWKTYL